MTDQVLSADCNAESANLLSSFRIINRFVLPGDGFFTKTQIMLQILAVGCGASPAAVARLQASRGARVIGEVGDLMMTLAIVIGLWPVISRACGL